MKARTIIATMMATAMLSSACSKSPEVHIFKPTDVEDWKRQEAIRFSLPPVEGDTLYSLDVEVRINRRYPYQDLWFLVASSTARTPNKKNSAASLPETCCDTLRFTITDADGNFTGKGRDLLTYTQSLPHPLRLSSTDTTHITISHLMDRATIQGVSDIGIHTQP
ncbi:MAG: gliding motility lipoprotein GldH [Bacteroidales bacterium]|nr:gliding motility lipoprotein GldH [Candidatus Physcousia equi]